MAIFPSVPGPGLGPTLADGVDKDLLRRLQRNATDGRQREARIRRDMLEGDWKEWIKARAKGIHDDAARLADVYKFVTTNPNPFRAVVGTVAIAYKKGVRRVVEGDDDSQAALNRFFDEAGASTKAPRWNRLADAAGAPLVIPRVTRRGTGVLDVIPCDCLEIDWDPDDLEGDPIRAAWTIASDETVPNDKTAVFKVVDAHSYRYYNNRKQLIAEFEHRFGEFPGVVFRRHEPVDGDVWGLEASQGLVDGGLDVGYAAARLLLMRKERDARQVAVFGDEGQIPDNQALMGGEQPLRLLYGHGEDRPDVKVLELNENPEYAIATIRALSEWMAESRGIPGSSVTFDAGTDPRVTIDVSAELLTELRGEQIEWMDRGETRLRRKVVLAMIAGGHPARFDLNPRHIVENGRTEFPELNRVHDWDKTARRLEFELKHGIRSPESLIQFFRPYLTDAEAREELLKNAEARAIWAKFLQTHGLALDLASNVITSPEFTGRQGGRPRNNEPPDGETAPNGN